MAKVLDPDARSLLEMWATTTTVAPEDQSLEQLRNSGLINPQVTGPAPDVRYVEDAEIGQDEGPPIPVRVYRTSQQQLPVIVYAHGGGWTLLSIDSVDTLCRHIAIETNCVVVSVGYRLAPEHPFPAAFIDVLAATTWVADGGLGWLPPRLAVAGDSAGGNLAAAVALHVRDQHTFPIHLQLLLYPATGLDLDTPSMRELGPDPRFRLSRGTMRWFWSNYLDGDLSISDQRALPALARDFSRLPPAVIVTPGFDPLKDDGRAYSVALAAHAVPVDLIVPEALPHGFAMMLGAVPATRRALNDITQRVRHLMYPHGSTPPRALATEFRQKPFGRHSEELQNLLHEMRSQPIAGKHILFISDPNRQWVLGRYSMDMPPQPEIDWSVRFDNLDDAEWHVFKLRWNEMFGDELHEEVSSG